MAKQTIEKKVTRKKIIIRPKTSEVVKASASVDKISSIDRSELAKRQPRAANGRFVARRV